MYTEYEIIGSKRTLHVLYDIYETSHSDPFPFASLTTTEPEIQECEFEWLIHSAVDHSGRAV